MARSVGYATLEKDSSAFGRLGHDVRRFRIAHQVASDSPGVRCDHLVATVDAQRRIRAVAVR